MERPQTRQQARGPRGRAALRPPPLRSPRQPWESAHLDGLHPQRAPGAPVAQLALGQREGGGEARHLAVEESEVTEAGPPSAREPLSVIASMVMAAPSCAALRAAVPQAPHVARHVRRALSAQAAATTVTPPPLRVEWASERPVAAATTDPALRRGPPLFSVAPMMEATDTHFRHLCRLMSRHATLWTEMVVESTVNHCPGDAALRHLDYTVVQSPLVLQLGGSNPGALATAAARASQFGYDELNLNCGCPSPRVAGRGCFGAALMTSPDTVAEACAQMRASSGLEVSVKCRTGVDDTDSYAELCRFVETVASRGGVTHFVVHARKALLDGLSPEDNRRIPPLQYERIYALCRDFPELRFTLNGGLRSMAHVHAARAHAQQALGGDGAGLAGVMLGRAAWERPWQVLSDVDRAVYGDPAGNPAASRRAVIQEYCAYADAIRDAEADAHDDGAGGVARFGKGHPRVRALVKPLLNLFTGVPRGKMWRAVLDDALLQHTRLSEDKQRAARVADLINASLRVLSPAALDEPPPVTAPHGDADAMEVLAHGFNQAAMPSPAAVAL